MKKFISDNIIEIIIFVVFPIGFLIGFNLEKIIRLF